MYVVVQNMVKAEVPLPEIKSCFAGVIMDGVEDAYIWALTQTKRVTETD